MSQATDFADSHDVMQVCRNGHVITDLLHSYPERGLFHCDRCGAQTIDRCLTCGAKIPGAIPIPGLSPAGSNPAPNYCVTCGAAFPWTPRPRLPASNPRAQLETLLRRLPRVVRQLRSRQADRPAFRVQDVRDLEDLLRALLPLYFDDIRPENRTPRYARGNQTDFLLFPQGIAVTAKLVSPGLRELGIASQLQEDKVYYSERRNCSQLIGFIHDPQGLLREPLVLERTWSGREEELDVRCIIAVS